VCKKEEGKAAEKETTVEIRGIAVRVSQRTGTIAITAIIVKKITTITSHYCHYLSLPVVGLLVGTLEGAVDMMRV